MVEELRERSENAQTALESKVHQSKLQIFAGNFDSRQKDKRSAGSAISKLFSALRKRLIRLRRFLDENCVQKFIKNSLIKARKIRAEKTTKRAAASVLAWLSPPVYLRGSRRKTV
jgi:superfamily I DNA and RNA helicase